MSPIRVTRTVELDLCSKGDDHALATVTLHLTCDVSPGEDAHGHGEHYDPGSGDEVLLVSVTGSADGVLAPVVLSLPLRDMAEAWLDRNADEIIADAADHVAEAVP